MTLSRREFVRLAAAMGASLAWGGPARASTTGWQERRDLYPEGVASGDPDANSVSAADSFATARDVVALFLHPGRTPPNEQAQHPP